LDLNILKDAGHTYVGFEDEVAQLVNKFVNWQKIVIKNTFLRY
jgi:hypothetical protein